MNRYVYIIVVGFSIFTCTTSINAQIGSTTNDKKTQKQIAKILKSVNTYDSIPKSISSASEFWQHIIDGSQEYTDYENNKSGFREKIRVEFVTLVLEGQDNQSKIDTTLNLYFSGTTNQLIGITIDNDESPNACVTPLGHIYVTPALLNMLSPDETMAILAHETAHYMLCHSEINYYESKRSERSNKIAAAISGALVVAADAYAASEGVKVNPNTTTQNVTNLMVGFADNATRFKYRYSRENEMAADIAAVRFLNWRGIEETALIDALRKLAGHTAKNGADNHSTSAYDTHPSLMFRIVLLETLLKGDHKSQVKTNHKDPLYN